MKGNQVVLILTLCATACVTALPAWGNSCKIEKRKGGILYTVFFTCDWKFNGNVTGVGAVGPITDYTAWALGVTNGKIVLSPKGYGEEPEPEFTTERVEACNSDDITGEKHTVNFISKSFDNTNYTHCKQWNLIRSNSDSYRFGWIGCDGLYYGNDSNATPASQEEPGYPFVLTKFGRITPDNNDSLQSVTVGLKFSHEGIVCPQNIANLLAAFPSLTT